MEIGDSTDCERNFVEADGIFDMTLYILLKVVEVDISTAILEVENACCWEMPLPEVAKYVVLIAERDPDERVDVLILLEFDAAATV